ncbi:MAG: ketoacyl-ACP synthase III [Peptococcaceae bacterium]|jgi:3-oxoacyl-[acyl-carrier-protein] synthase-3|nr:ketoacyl-ACP synthase III [Peptococcaceae bacterium]
MYNVEIIGTGSYVPEHRVSNDDLAKFVDTSDQWIRERTGIIERRISLEENTTELAVKAAQRALEDAHIAPEEIDLLIVATVTPDYFFPSTACLIQQRIGAVKAVSFDISAACTGFIFGLSIAGQFLKTGMYRTALVLGAEVFSKIIDWEDRNTCVLFADGAGAAVLRRGAEGIISELIRSDGSGAGHLECPAVPLQNKFSACSTEKRPSYTLMNGREVFKFAVRIIPEYIEKVLTNTGYTLEDIKYIIPHQANTRIVAAAAKKLGVDQAKFYVNIQYYGNTSGASIPLALDEMSRQGLLQKGDLFIIVGFGAGLTYGAQLIRWTKG